MTAALFTAQADAAARAGDLAGAARLLTQAVAASPGSAEPWLKLAACRRALGDGAGALGALEAALTLTPRDPVALLMKGALLAATGADAEEPYRAALAFISDRAGLPPALQAQVTQAERVVASAASRRHARLAASLASLADQIDFTPGERARVETFTAVLAADDTVTILPGLDRPDFIDPARITGLVEVARAHARFTADYLALMRADGTAVPYVNHPTGVPLDQWAALNKSRDWSAAHLLAGGARVEPNASACSATMAAWNSLPLPTVPGRSPNLMFSILSPRTHIPRHQGVFNARLVVHVPLLIPAGCLMTVGETARAWRPGEALVFDDTIPHEAVNDSDLTRVVLIGDAWHPDLSPKERTALSALMAADKPAARHGL